MPAPLPAPSQQGSALPSREVITTVKEGNKEMWPPPNLSELEQDRQRSPRDQPSSMPPPVASPLPVVPSAITPAPTAAPARPVEDQSYKAFAPTPSVSGTEKGVQVDDDAKAELKSEVAKLEDELRRAAENDGANSSLKAEAEALQGKLNMAAQEVAQLEKIAASRLELGTIVANAAQEAATAAAEAEAGEAAALAEMESKMDEMREELAASNKGKEDVQELRGELMAAMVSAKQLAASQVSAQQEMASSAEQEKLRVENQKLTQAQVEANRVMEQLKDDLRKNEALLRDNASTDAELAALKKAEASSKQENDRLRTRAEMLELEQATANAKVETYEQALADAKRQSMKLTANLDKGEEYLLKEHMASQEEMRQLHNDMLELTQAASRDRGNLKDELTVLLKQELMSENGGANSGDLDKAKIEIVEMRSNLERLQEDNVALTACNKIANDGQQDLMDRTHHLQKELDRSEEALLAEQMAARRQLDELRQGMGFHAEAASREREEIKKGIEAILGSTAGQAELDRLRSEAHNLRTEVVERERKICDLTRAIADVTTKKAETERGVQTDKLPDLPDLGQAAKSSHVDSAPMVSKSGRQEHTLGDGPTLTSVMAMHAFSDAGKNGANRGGSLPFPGVGGNPQRQTLTSKPLSQGSEDDEPGYVGKPPAGRLSMKPPVPGSGKRLSAVPGLGGTDQPRSRFGSQAGSHIGSQRPSISGQWLMNPVEQVNDTKMWDKDHMREVVQDMFPRHDLDNSGCIAWKSGEAMSFLQEFFELHSMPPPKLPSAVFATLYNQVRMHRDVPEEREGLDPDEMIEFATKVHEFIYKNLKGEMKDIRRKSGVCPADLPPMSGISDLSPRGSFRR